MPERYADAICSTDPHLSIVVNRWDDVVKGIASY